MEKKLKTLIGLETFTIDPECNGKDIDVVSIDKLRIEAIKWVKYLGETTENENTEENVEISNWIRHFFNLSNEDLEKEVGK